MQRQVKGSAPQRELGFCSDRGARIPTASKALATSEYTHTDIDKRSFTVRALPSQFAGILGGAGAADTATQTNPRLEVM